MRVIQTISCILGKTLEVLVVVLLMLMTVLMFAQVLGRFVFQNGLFWAEELSRFTMITLVYLGAAVACKNKDHISVTILDGILKGTPRKIYKVLVALLSISFLIIVAKVGFSVLHIVSSQKSANMQITMNLIYMIIPISSCIMVFFLLIEILQLFTVQKNDDSPMEEAAAQGKKI